MNAYHFQSITDFHLFNHFELLNRSLGSLNFPSAMYTTCLQYHRDNHHLHVHTDLEFISLKSDYHIAQDFCQIILFFSLVRKNAITSLGGV